ncbi:MAG: hypothetical protein OXU71_00260 [Gammaproteobacteria bacterium]|nr:hypothetical protein [Gammaproteobacteria bacterium]
MTHKIIMPALGMNQDTGVIVSWGKAPGEFVAVGDVIMDVETDKAIQEIEASQAGYLSRVQYQVGAEVPVGEVVAVLTDKPEDETQSASTIRAKGIGKTPQQAPPAESEARTPARQSPPNTNSAMEPEGKLLASPKAKRLAAEAGLDLNKLASARGMQPLHAADIAELRALESAPLPGGVAVAVKSTICARVEADALLEFRRVLERNSGNLDRASILAVFAASALRFCIDIDEKMSPLVVAVSAGSGKTFYSDPDLRGFSNLAPVELTEPPTLLVRDTRDSGIISIKLADDAPLAITVSDRPNAVEIEFSFDEPVLPGVDAIRVVSELVARITEPMRLLL